ncbi:hypothetical protein FT225_08715 [Escherichia coli]|nr:hypothetical protein [Escherichia coli]
MVLSGSSAVDSVQLIIIIFCGSFPAIRLVTGRRPRRFSLFMKIFWFMPFPFFFLFTHCFC